MKTFQFSITRHGAIATAIAVIADDDNGGNAVPSFGVEAVRLASLYLEEISTATVQGELTFTHMLNDGKTFDELKAARAAIPIVYHQRPREPHNEN